MPRLWLTLLATLLALPLVSPPALLAQDPPPAADKDKEKEKPRDDKAKDKDKDDEPPTETLATITTGGTSVYYTARAGYLPIRDLEGTTEAKMFFVSYTRNAPGDRATRPLVFAFNGGPGSSSVWLHLGALGPKRVVMPPGPTIPAPPFRLTDNGESWLDVADLVFIDPVETGFSRATKPELNKKFHGLTGDISSVGEFIRLYLTRNERWTSPLFVAGKATGRRGRRGWRARWRTRGSRSTA